MVADVSEIQGYPLAQQKIVGFLIYGRRCFGDTVSK